MKNINPNKFRTIGVSTLGYPEKRNFARLSFKKYKVEKVQNIHKIPAYLIHKFKGYVHPYYWNSFKDYDLNDCDIYHLFKGISFGKKPWISTFETYIPRWGRQKKTKLQSGVELLVSEPCKKLIAISACSKNIQEQYLNENFPNFSDIISSKIKVIHPAQNSFIKTYLEKKLKNDRIIFTLVGNQVFSKGGREVIKVLSNFNHKKFPIKLQLISNLSTDNYASFTNQSDVTIIKKLIAKNQSYIDYYCNISNDKVKQLLLQSHIALLPTYADTYGYFVLEAQAAGCPVITTNIRALPEINNNEIGWIIDIPKKPNGNAKLDSIEERRKFSDLICDQLEYIINHIFTNNQLIQIKGKLCLKRINEKHNPIDVAKRLELIYDEALK